MNLQAWLERLENGPLRRHYDVFLAVIVGGLVVTAIVSAATVLWASSSVRNQADRVVDLQTANQAIFQDATDAYFGLHRVGSLKPADSMTSYEIAVGHLPGDQRRLEELAGGEETLRKAIARQEDAIRTWLEDYAEPLADPDEHGPVKLAPGDFAELGQDLFAAIRVANEAVGRRINGVEDGQGLDNTLAAESDDRTRIILLVALTLVTLLPVVAVGGVILIGRRLQRSVVAPLGGITRVLEELRSGEAGARTEVTGPAEVRQIAAGLNLLTEENVRASEVEADVLMQLQTIDRVRTDLVSTVSHELRTPLASIKGYLELLQDDLMEHMTPQQTSMMSAIRRNLDRLNELIANLLALSRAEETELSLNPVDLRAVATEVGTDIRLTAAGRDISIRLLHSSRPVVVLGDRSQLIRAVQNLVTNAVKFSRPGGTVELRVSRDGEEAVLAVEDEGIGIPVEDLQGLGSRFYRASNAVQAEIAGTGLGLRIVQTILGRHGGHLSVDSVEGEGSTFTVRLPLSNGLEPAKPAPTAGDRMAQELAQELAQLTGRDGRTVPEPA